MAVGDPGDLCGPMMTSDTWGELFRSLDRLRGVTADATHQFEGLLAILRGSRPKESRHPLCIDGHEYHRRQRRRVKRNKRNRKGS